MENLTGFQKITRFEHGESVPKFTGFKKGKRATLRFLGPLFVSENRYQREIDAMDEMNSDPDKLVKAGFVVPKVLGEWPEYDLIAVEYIEGKSGHLMTEQQIQSYVELMSGLSINPLYNFRDGVYSSLKNTSLIPQKYQAEYFDAYDKIVDAIDWDLDEIGMIHGDFHYNNLISTVDGLIGLIDWEYATNGSIYFDLGCYESLSKFKFPEIYEKRIEPWRDFIELMLTHWHMSYYNEQVENHERWMGKLREVVSNY